MPISPTLPADGDSNWDVPLNAALTTIVTEVNTQGTAIAGKAATSHTHAASDVTSGTIATARLGSGTASSSTFLRGDNTWATPAGGGGGVSSVNGDSGPSVTLDQDDIGDGTTYKQYSATEKSKLAGIASGATANSADATLLARANHTGTQSADTLTDGTTNKAFLATERTKLTGIATGATANSSDATLLARANHTGTQSADTLTDGTTNKAFLATERTKLTGIATGATANDTDANLKARANHTGTQTASTISDFSTAANTAVKRESVFSQGGTLTTGTGVFRLYNRSGVTRTISTVTASVGTQPTGASILVDVNISGTTIFTTQSNRPSIAVSTNEDESGAPDVTAWTNGSYLTIDIDQIGSTVAGANLVVTVVWS